MAIYIYIGLAAIVIIMDVGTFKNDDLVFIGNLHKVFDITLTVDFEYDSSW